MRHFTPATEGEGFEVSRILKPIEQFADQMHVLTGLNGVPSNAGVHAGAATRFLTGVTPARTESDLRAGVFGRSVDRAQLRAAHPARFAPSWRSTAPTFPVRPTAVSVAATRTRSRGAAKRPRCRARTTRAPFSSGSAVTPGRPTHRRGWPGSGRSGASSIQSPTRSTRCSRGSGPTTGSASTSIWRRSATSSAASRRRRSRATASFPRWDQPAGVPATYEEHAKLMFDLMLLAYQTDLTRVSTYMLAPEISGRTYPEIGVPDSHHPTSHHRNDPILYEKIARINEFHIGLFGYFLEKARATPDGDGSLLDHMMLLYGAGMSDSNAHDNRGLPMVIVGGGSGALKPGGRHLVHKDRTPATNLHLTILDKMGMPVDKIADSTGPLDLLSVS